MPLVIFSTRVWASVLLRGYYLDLIYITRRYLVKLIWIDRIQ